MMPYKATVESARLAPVALPLPGLPGPPKPVRLPLLPRPG